MVGYSVSDKGLDMANNLDFSQRTSADAPSNTLDFSSRISEEPTKGLMTKTEEKPKHSGTFDNHQEFMKAVFPLAQKIGEEIGLDPRLILAQSAVETGWGSVVKGNSFFGVKSHGANVPSIKFKTQEEVNGERVKITDSFRAYDSLEDSIEGYGKFLMDNPRYAKYLAADTLEDAAKELQKSGYATASNYGSTVLSIAKGPLLTNYLKTVGYE